MEIKFNNLMEIKEFVLMIDLYQLCKDQEKWGGKGYIITDKDYNLESEEEFTVTEPEQSKVYHRSADEIIVTPYVKQLSWLFKTLYWLSNENPDILDPHTLLGIFHVGCEGYFIMNPHHYPQELMLFVLDTLIRSENARHERERDEREDK